MDSALSCGVCFENYDGEERCPRALSCLHTFCSACLHTLIQLLGEDSIIKCPTCKQTTTLSKAGNVTDLLRNFELQEAVTAHQRESVSERLCEICDEQVASHHCLDCEEFLCDRDTMAHRKSKASKDHTVVTLAEFRSGCVCNTEKATYCLAHPSRSELHELTLCCKTCNQQPICRDCIVIDHKDHDFAFIETVAKEVRGDIARKTEEIERSCVDLTEGINFLTR